jgi:hypothetical protein
MRRGYAASPQDPAPNHCTSARQTAPAGYARRQRRVKTLDVPLLAPICHSWLICPAQLRTNPQWCSGSLDFPAVEHVLGYGASNDEKLVENVQQEFHDTFIAELNP